MNTATVSPQGVQTDESLKAARLCRCGGPARRGQRDCHKCHRERQKVYRSRDAVELRRYRALSRESRDDPGTKFIYTTRFRSRYVIYTDDVGASEPVEVIGFLPSSWLRVLRRDGSIRAVKMEKVIEDKGRQNYE